MASPAPEAANRGYSRLPFELVQAICGGLSNRDIKQLRLSCTFFARTARLRLRRAFLSPNPRNIDVFLALAHDDLFRHDIVEVILEDALLPCAGCIVNVNEVELCLLPGPNAKGCDDDHPPSWFHMVCHDNITELLDLNFLPRGERWRAQQLPWRDAWKFYLKLIREQAEVLESGAYERALHVGLANFSALRKITITGATHGRAFNPLYETPMIRSFPPRFNYPTPRGWIGDNIAWPICPPWEEKGGGWIGFRTAMRALAENRDSGRVVDVAIDAHGLQTGINVNLFKGPWPSDLDDESNVRRRDWPTLKNLEAVLARPGLKNFQLDLMLFGEEHQRTPFSWLMGSDTESGRLGRALESASDGHGLESLSIGGNMRPFSGWPSFGRAAAVPLKSIFTPASLSRLRHFGFSGLWVSQDELVQEVLSHLPLTLKTIDLSCLEFRQGSYNELLEDIADNLGWRERDIRPRLTICLPVKEILRGRMLCLDAEVAEFLYGSGANPFAMPAGERPTAEALTKLGLGTMTDKFGSDISMSPLWTSPTYTANNDAEAPDTFYI